MAQLEVPDKGRAWLIAFCACIINTILSGLSRMIGILYVTIIDDYGVSRKTATLPFTVRNSVRCLSGPVVGVLGQRFGVRAVSFWGGVIAFVGAALCYIAPSVAWITVFWGVIHGVGFALANTLFQVVVNQYFEKHRATASGIAQSGACVGSLGFPFMIEGILDAYGLSGSFLILAAIVMHVLPASLMLSSPPWVKDPGGYAKQVALLELKSNKDTTMDGNKHTNDTELEHCLVENSPTRAEEPINGVTVEQITTNNYFEKVAGSDGLSTDNPCDMEAVNACKTFTWEENAPHGDTVNKDASTLSAQVANPSSTQKTTIVDGIKSIANLCLNPMYILTSLSMAIYVIVFIPILTCIVDYSIDKGIPESYGKYLITAMSVGDLLGRLCFGWITDKGILSLSVFMTLALALQGIWIALFPLANSFYSFMALLVLYGMVAGSILVLFPVLVHKYVEQKLQSVAIGCVGFTSGVVSFFLPFLIGHFRDYVGSYDGLFYLTGFISVTFGGLWLLEPQMEKLYHSKMKNSKEKNVEEN